MCGKNPQTHGVDLEPTGPNAKYKCKSRCRWSNSTTQRDVDSAAHPKFHSVQEKPTSYRQARPTACLWYPRRSPTDSIARIPRPTVTLTLSNPQIGYAATTVYKTVVVVMERCKMLRSMRMSGRRPEKMKVGNRENFETSLLLQLTLVLIRPLARSRLVLVVNSRQGWISSPLPRY
jgi:hypothetical protein